MANPDAAFGFRPVANDGGVYNGQTRRCVVAAAESATAVFVGDMVKLDAVDAETGGYQAVTIATGGNPVYGVITSFEADPDDLSKQYRVASTRRFCQVALADNQLFVCQGQGNPGLAGVGLNAAYVQGAGSTVTGYSGAELVTATADSTGDLQIVGGYDAPDNDNTASNAIWTVKFNDPQSKPHRVGT